LTALFASVILSVLLEGQVKRILCTLVFMLCGAAVCSAQSVLQFPEFLDGTANRNSVVWASIIGLTNPAAPGSAMASGTITLTNDNGTPMNVALTDVLTGSTGNTFQLAGGQTKLFFSISTSAATPQPLNVGFATVTSSLPLAGALTIVEYGPYLNFDASGSALSQASVLASTPLTKQGTVIAKFPGSDIGLAFANPGTATAIITFQLLDSTGATVGAPVTRTLAASNHTAFLVSQIFPSLTSGMFVGSVRITSDNPVASIALLLGSNNLFSSLPIIPIQ
jgi:hypothetical protein